MSELLFLLFTATVSQSLSTLPKKEQHRWFVFAYVFDTFSLILPLFMSKSESLLPLFSLSLFFKERQKLFALFALYKKKNVSEWLPLLITKELTWAIRSRRSLQKIYMSNFLFFESKLLFRSQKWFARKKRRANSYPACAQAESQQNFFLFFLY